MWSRVCAGNQCRSSKRAAAAPHLPDSRGILRPGTRTITRKEKQTKRETEQVEKVNHRPPSKNPSFGENRCSALDFSVFVMVDLTWVSILGGGWGMCGWKERVFPGRETIRDSAFGESSGGSNRGVGFESNHEVHPGRAG